ncbi:MAG TPA: DUF2891 domain-containing protein [Blastocatellia bacterium]|nr:DUF2891 domain-containing protein [Blastocatellia bacterium]
MNRFKQSILLFLIAACLLLASPQPFEAASLGQDEGPPPKQMVLTLSEASHFAGLAMKCITREYPNKPDHTNNDASDVRSPRSMHPAFYGCFDWHSSVHGHWMLVRLLRLFPKLPEAQRIRDALNNNLSAESISGEVQYLSQENRQSFERTYGWAWLLKLAEELHNWNDEDGRRWSKNLTPLADALADKYISFLPKQNYPIRTGVHPNTAFGLAFALDYARAAGNQKLAALVEERSRTYFARDVNYPVSLEPGGEDFFSPALMEADLMSRVMEPIEFRRWFHRFLPGLGGPASQTLLRPALILDRRDPKLVHLDGLNLSRAWCMRSIAARLAHTDPLRFLLTRAAEAHASEALSHVASGDYAGEHWLASFAVYLLSLNRI